MNPDFDVIILGAGLGGLGMAASLKKSGYENFVIVEQSNAPGGTWRDNTYPGAACDTESHLYCYSFSLHLDVSRLYARQPELLRYAERLVEEHVLNKHIVYNTRILAADWDDKALLWKIRLEHGLHMTARVFIPAWGQLNRPYVPDLAGLDTFKGQQFHSARWPKALDLTGKRVASIGNAASAVQYIPEIAPQARHLTVFQRSPNWIVPRGDRPYSTEELATYVGDPAKFRANKAELFAWRESTFKRMLEGSEDALELERMARAHVEAQVPDASLRAKLTPNFPLGCKRILRSDDYYPALMRKNVSLETSPIERILPKGILTQDGHTHAVDVMIFGTGFETQSFQGSVEVRGAWGHVTTGCLEKRRPCLSRYHSASISQSLSDLRSQHESWSQLNPLDVRSTVRLHPSGDSRDIAPWLRRPGRVGRCAARLRQQFAGIDGRHGVVGKLHQLVQERRWTGW